MGKELMDELTAEIQVAADRLRRLLVDAQRAGDTTLQDLFTQYNVSNSGALGVEEWCEGLEDLGVASSRAVLEALFRRYDIDDSGQIEYREFLQLQPTPVERITEELRAALQPYIQRNTVRNFLERYGSTEKGLDKERFLRLLRDLRVGAGIGPTDREAVFTAYDADGSGALELSEFLTIVADRDRRRQIQERQRLKAHLRAVLQEKIRNPQALRAVFDAHVRKGSTGLTEAQFAGAVHDMGINLSSHPDDLHAIFESFDESGNGLMEFEEFLHALTDSQQMEQEHQDVVDAITRRCKVMVVQKKGKEKLTKALMAQATTDGYIDSSGFATALTASNVTSDLGAPEVQAAFRVFDTDRDGCLLVADFVAEVEALEMSDEQLKLEMVREKHRREQMLQEEQERELGEIAKKKAILTAEMAEIRKSVEAGLSSAAEKLQAAQTLGKLLQQLETLKSDERTVTEKYRNMEVKYESDEQRIVEEIRASADVTRRESRVKQRIKASEAAQIAKQKAAQRAKYAEERAREDKERKAMKAAKETRRTQIENLVWTVTDDQEKMKLMDEWNEISNFLQDFDQQTEVIEARRRQEDEEVALTADDKRIMMGIEATRKQRTGTKSKPSGGHNQGAQKARRGSMIDIDLSAYQIAGAGNVAAAPATPAPTVPSSQKEGLGEFVERRGNSQSTSAAAPVPTEHLAPPAPVRKKRRPKVTVADAPSTLGESKEKEDEDRRQSNVSEESGEQATAPAPSSTSKRKQLPQQPPPPPPPVVQVPLVTPLKATAPFKFVDPPILSASPKRPLRGRRKQIFEELLGVPERAFTCTLQFTVRNGDTVPMVERRCDAIFPQTWVRAVRLREPPPGVTATVRTERLVGASGLRQLCAVLAKGEDEETFHAAGLRVAIAFPREFRFMEAKAIVQNLLLLEDGLDVMFPTDRAALAQRRLRLAIGGTNLSESVSKLSACRDLPQLVSLLYPATQQALQKQGTQPILKAGDNKAEDKEGEDKAPVSQPEPQNDKEKDKKDTDKKPRKRPLLNVQPLQLTDDQQSEPYVEFVHLPGGSLHWSHVQPWVCFLLLFVENSCAGRVTAAHREWLLGKAMLLAAKEDADTSCIPREAFYHLFNSLIRHVPLYQHYRRISVQHRPDRVKPFLRFKDECNLSVTSSAGFALGASVTDFAEPSTEDPPSPSVVSPLAQFAHASGSTLVSSTANLLRTRNRAATSPCPLPPNWPSPATPDLAVTAPSPTRKTAAEPESARAPDTDADTTNPNDTQPTIVQQPQATPSQVYIIPEVGDEPLPSAEGNGDVSSAEFDALVASASLPISASTSPSRLLLPGGRKRRQLLFPGRQSMPILRPVSQAAAVPSPKDWYL